MSSKGPLLRTNILLCTSTKVKIRLQESIMAVQDPKCRHLHLYKEISVYFSHNLRKESSAEGALLYYNLWLPLTMSKDPFSSLPFLLFVFVLFIIFAA